MNHQEVRDKFRDYLKDDELYKTFVAHLIRTRKNRLLYKQELRWNEFQREFLDCEYSFNDLKEMFRVCEVHGNELIQGSSSAFRGHIDFSSEYTRALIECFPNTKPIRVMVPEDYDGNRVKVWFCEQCLTNNEEYDKELAKIV